MFGRQPKSSPAPDNRFTGPVRFSRNWWLAIVSVTITVGTITFIFLKYHAGLALEELLLYWIVLTFAGDVVTALSMEAVSPTRVAIGPGDRKFKNDIPAEMAVIVSDFGSLGVGRVRLRGESWRAKCVNSDTAELRAGTRVRVIDREGLTLIVSKDVNSSS